MPSRSGGMIKDKFEALLNRDLTTEEVLKCEEIALNWFTGPILTYLERSAKKPVKHLFEIVAMAIMNGVVRGAERSRRVEFTPRLVQVYKKLDLYKPQMTDGEMQAVVELCDKFSDRQIDAAIVAARARGVRHARYVLQVCVGNKDRPGPRTKTKIKEREPEVLRPSKEAVDSSWAKSLEDAEERKTLNDIERMVNRDRS